MALMIKEKPPPFVYIPAVSLMKDMIKVCATLNDKDEVRLALKWANKHKEIKKKNWLPSFKFNILKIL